jgi:hypothetical protein
MLTPGGIVVNEASTFVGTIIIECADGSNHYDVKGNIKRVGSDLAASNVSLSLIGEIDQYTRAITSITVTSPSAGYFVFTANVADNVVNPHGNSKNMISMHLRIHEMQKSRSLLV